MEKSGQPHELSLILAQGRIANGRPSGYSVPDLARRPILRRREYYWSLFHRPAKNQLDDLRTDQIEAVYAAVPKNRHSEYLVWKEGFTNWKPLIEFPDILISLRTAPQKHEAAPLPAPDTSRFAVPDSATIHPVGKKSSNRKASEDHLGHTDPKVKIASDMPDKKKKSKQREETSVTREAAGADGNVIILGGSVQRGGAADLKSSHREDTGFTEFSSADLKTSSHSVFSPKEVSKIGGVAITADDELSGVFLSLDTTSHSEDRGNGRYIRKLPVRIVAGDIQVQTCTIDVSANGLRVDQMLPGNLPKYFNVELQTYKGTLSMVCSAVQIDGGPTNRLKIEINDFPEILQSLLIAG